MVRVPEPRVTKAPKLPPTFAIVLLLLFKSNVAAAPMLYWLLVERALVDWARRMIPAPALRVVTPAYEVFAPAKLINPAVSWKLPVLAPVRGLVIVLAPPELLLSTSVPLMT